MPNTQTPPRLGLSAEDQLRLARAPKLASPQTPIDPSKTEVFQRGADGKLHPIPGWRTTGPFDFGTWAHNVDWMGVVRDLAKIGLSSVGPAFAGRAMGATGLGVVGDGASAVKVVGAATGAAATGNSAIDELSPRKKPANW